MTQSVEDLAQSLLYEGYALYPYTSTNAKNATPTPFGIVYPPAYAERLPTLHDCLQIQCIVEYEPDATLEGTVLFLVPSGVEYRAAEQRLKIDYTPIGFLESEPGVVGLELSPDEHGRGGLKAEARLSAEVLTPGQARMTLRVDNLTEVPADEARDWDRPQALVHSLISTHAFVKISGGKFVSPLESKDERVSGCKHINSWPVLATEEDDSVLGAAIMLPEYPKIASESKLNFFDNTEIEEALVLHAQTLPDEMLEDIAKQDPAVQEMIACARQVTPEELLKMHGRLEMAEPGREQLKSAAGKDPLRRFEGKFQAEPPPPPGDMPDFPEFQSIPPEYQGSLPTEPRPASVGLKPMETEDFSGRHQSSPPKVPEGYEDAPGAEEIDVDGRHFKRGDRVVLHLMKDARQDAIDHLLNGKSATIERILTDYDGSVHFGVTIEGDPGQQLLRETNRFMYFFAHEVEVLPE
ncbi:MAG: hypothetical protein WD602_08375 [Actinomycetota bacterium]